MMPRARSQDTGDDDAPAPSKVLKDLPDHDTGTLEPKSASEMCRAKTSRGRSRVLQVYGAYVLYQFDKGIWNGLASTVD